MPLRDACTSSAISAIALFAVIACGCGDDGRSAPQKAGDETKGAAEHTGKALEKAADKTGEAAQDAGEKVHDATH